MSATRYPLSWPAGWPRTEAQRRRRAAFRAGGRGATRALSVYDSLGRLVRELRLLGARDEILSTNVEVRLDGMPRSGQAEPRDPGAAVYFELSKKPTVLACDRWDRVADNIAAIAQHIDALRRMDRYGVGSLAQAFAGYTALPQQTEQGWWEIFGLTAEAKLEEVEEAYRRLARIAHPDAGGAHEAMARLNTARDAARQALGG